MYELYLWADYLDEREAAQPEEEEQDNTVDHTVPSYEV